MLKKASLLLLLAMAVFAAPANVRFDDPFPACYPCPPGTNPWDGR
jgi:hypothetical protein